MSNTIGLDCPASVFEQSPNREAMDFAARLLESIPDYDKPMTDEEFLESIKFSNTGEDYSLVSDISVEKNEETKKRISALFNTPNCPKQEI